MRFIFKILRLFETFFLRWQKPRENFSANICVFLSLILRALESLRTDGRNSRLWEDISLAEVIMTLEDLIDYFAPPGEIGNAPALVICAAREGVSGFKPGADRAAWLPGTCTCVPVGPPSRWAATSNVEVGQTTYPVNRGRVWMPEREESEGQSHKRRGEGRREWNWGWDQGFL